MIFPHLSLPHALTLPSHPHALYPSSSSSLLPSSCFFPTLPFPHLLFACVQPGFFTLVWFRIFLEDGSPDTGLGFPTSINLIWTFTTIMFNISPRYTILYQACFDKWLCLGDKGNHHNHKNLDQYRKTRLFTSNLANPIYYLLQNTPFS